jgi:enamine deaminase RidA (YjgF/YER057c/UK114 family)
MKKISSGSAFEALVGFSRAVVDESYVHLSGTTGYDYAEMRISECPLEQCHQCFRNIADALGQAGCSLEDIVRVRYYLTHVSLFERLTPIFSSYLSSVRPATSAIVCQLVDPLMKVEIEVTARLPSSERKAS